MNPYIPLWLYATSTSHFSCILKLPGGEKQHLPCSSWVYTDGSAVKQVLIGKIVKHRGKSCLHAGDICSLVELIWMFILAADFQEV